MYIIASMYLVGDSQQENGLHGSILKFMIQGSRRMIHCYRREKNKFTYPIFNA